MFTRFRRGSSSRHQESADDTKLNTTSPRPRNSVERAPPPIPIGPRRISISSSPELSPPRSCVSSEDGLKYSSSPETTSMILVGCPRCLMYVMLSENDPRCPKCKSSVLLDFLQHDDDVDDDDDVDGDDMDEDDDDDDMDENDDK